MMINMALEWMDLGWMERNNGARSLTPLQRQHFFWCADKFTFETFVSFSNSRFFPSLAFPFFFGVISNLFQHQQYNNESETERKKYICLLFSLSSPILPSKSHKKHTIVAIRNSFFSHFPFTSLFVYAFFSSQLTQTHTHTNASARAHIFIDKNLAGRAQLNCYCCCRVESSTVCIASHFHKYFVINFVTASFAIVTYVIPSASITLQWRTHQHECHTSTLSCRYVCSLWRVSR